MAFLFNSLCLVHQVRKIFLALPANIQARVLLTGLRHQIENSTDFAKQPTDAESQSDVESDAGIENAVLAKKLLSAGGVVAVKLAQMLAEDPKIPRVSCETSIVLLHFFNAFFIYSPTLVATRIIIGISGLTWKPA